MNINAVAIPTYKPTTMYLVIIHLSTNFSSVFLGGLFKQSGSGLLKLRAVAGNPSVTKLTHNNYIELKPSGIPNREVIKIEMTSPILLDIIYQIKAFILAYIDLPSSIADIIVAKLSSTNIISEDSLATSVPWIPIAIPIDAYFKAGASLTPSPVIDTIY